MLSDKNIIYINRTALICCVKREDQTVSCRRWYLFFIDAKSPVLIIIGIPGVRKRNFFRWEGKQRDLRNVVGRVIRQFPEQPGIIEGDFSHFTTVISCSVFRRNLKRFTIFIRRCAMDFFEGAGIIIGI